MGLETGTYISDLVATNPTSDDPKSEGDNNIRLLKSTIKASFPNVTGAVTATHTELNILDGATVTAAELNVLDGITATVTELNYTDGVTSAIQTQLDGKQPLDADLTSLAAVSTLGFIVRTDAGTMETRQLQAGSAVTITYPDGVDGDPVIDLSPTVGAGDVLGPASSTNNALAVFDGTSGKLLKEGSITLPSGNVVGTTDTQTLTNKTIALGSNTVSGTLAEFNTACTDANFASIAGTETLTNKTLTSPTINTPTIATPAISAPTNTGAIYNNGSQRSNIVTQTTNQNSIDCSAGNYFVETITGSTNFNTGGFNNAPASRAYSFILKVIHTSGTITWPTSVKWPSDVAPTLTTGKTHFFGFLTDNGGTRWQGSFNGNSTS